MYVIFKRFSEKRTGNNIGDEGASKISESLMINTTLTQLDLDGNWKTTINKKWIVAKDYVLLNNE